MNQFLVLENAHSFLLSLSFFFSFGSVCGVQNLQNLKKRGWRMGPAGDLKVQLAGDAVNKLYYIHITQCTFC